MSKLPILIWSPRWTENIGGVIVLHKLCHMLREKGEEAYLWIDNNNISSGCINKNYNTPIGNGIIDPKNAVVIYPEGVVGDPLQAKVVVRWILYFPGTWGPKMEPGLNDLVFYFHSWFYPEGEILNNLCVLDFAYELFDNQQIQNRSGSCFIVRKGNNKNRIPETLNSFEIRSNNLDEIVRLFKSKEVFYSYDTETALSLQAAMCGCLSVVVPVPGITANEYRTKMSTHRYGIAYGTSEEELEYAKSTQHLVKDYLKSITKEGDRQLEVLLVKLDRLRKI